MAPAETVDVYKLHKADYVAPLRPLLVDIAEARYLTISGTGQPGAREFVDKTQALFATAYRMKDVCQARGCDYSVSKLEAIYWTDVGSSGFRTVAPGEWHWDLLIRMPDLVTETDLAIARDTLTQRNLLYSGEVTFKTLTEGQCVQMLHAGPYTAEIDTVGRMQMFARAERLEYGDLHHEIYLNDPRRTAPEKLRTILRTAVTHTAQSAHA